MIDLHLHTTASDGRLEPRALVARAAAAGATAISVTDHDTVAGLEEARREAESRNVEFIDGIEVTSVHEGRDVHILGYFIDPRSPALETFLREQRAVRVARVREIGARLARLGVRLDIEALLGKAAERPGASIGRPVVARAMVRAGHASSVEDAFDRFLGTGRPAFVPRPGRTPAEVVQQIHLAGGIASMAHPGLTGKPAVMRALASVGLDAVEVFHPDHPPDVQHALEAFAARRGLLVTGGSDFHGDDDRRDRRLGHPALPPPYFERLRAARTRV